jgi:hypothetical protein
MARKSKAFLARSAAAKKGARTRKKNIAIVEKVYRQLLRLEKKERRVTGARVIEVPDEGDFWEIEIGMSYGPGAE